MTELLCKLFIKHPQKVEDPSVRRSYGTMVSTVGIVVNLLLAAGKFLAGLLSGAVSVTADAANNLSDAASQIISLVSFRLAAKPADRDHPFGHARIEYVASMAVSFLVILVGFELFKSSVSKLFSPEETTFSLLAVIILSVSVLAKLWLCLFNRRVAKKINSEVMRATAADSLSDAAATSAVLVSLLVLRFFRVDIDAYVGMGVAVVILIAGVKLLGESKNLIIGEAPDADIVAAIRGIVAQYPEALGIHDMVVHNYGAGTVIASLHIEVDGAVDVFHTHDVIDTIEKRLGDDLGIRCTIHMDPIVTDDEEVTATRTLVAEAICSIHPEWHIHDFRFVKGDTHTNLIFDIVVPFECRLSDEEIRKKASETLSAINPSYCTVITIDKE